MTGTPKELATQLFALDPEKVYEIKEFKPVRGTQANRYFHKLINELARYNRSEGYALSDEEVKANINLAYGTLARDKDGKIQGVKVPKNTNIYQFYPYAKWYKEDKNCDCYIFYKRTHELNTKEFTQLIGGLERECKHVGIKTLDDIEFDLMMEAYEREYIDNRASRTTSQV